MAETVGSFLGAAIELAKCFVNPVQRQLNYLCCFSNNMHTLRDEAEKLDDAKQGLQMQVDSSKNNAHIILPEVETWLRSADEIKGSTSLIEDDFSDLARGSCLANVKARFSLSKRAVQNAEEMRELRGQRNFDTISQPPPPSAMGPTRIGNSIEFESRKKIEEEIMAALRDNSCNTIGICGMGGIGKTIMAERIRTRAVEERLVDEVAKTVVGQVADKMKIQLELAETLGMKLQEETLPARAHMLRARLTGTKRTLVVLDDVWERLSLESIGIPCESAGCTVLLTSRNRDALVAMNVQKVKKLEILPEQEARFLFKEKAGDCVDDPRLRSIAGQVMEECNGLPIALITVAMALQDERNVSGWRDALQQLKRSNPGDLPDVIAQVYNPLKLSYDFLENEHTKSLLLLCCLYLEDQSIPVERLTYFAMGLHILEGVRNLEEAKNRTYTLVRVLKNRFLLLDGQDEDHVRMHDVVRDVSIFIASKERRINCNDCTWISSFMDGKAKSQLEMGFPNLRLLWVDNSADEEFEIDDSFIGETTELNVLVVEHGPFRSLPNATELLVNLRTFILYKCANLEEISIVGELVNLEIFICHKCESIEELPVEIGKLNRLRLLQISKCENLETVAPGVISGLSGLEELKMVKSFDKWEAADKGEARENASLSELEALHKLTSLEIEVEDYTLAGEQIRLSPKLMKFDISIGDRQKHGIQDKKRLERNMTLWLEDEVSIGTWIKQCVSSVEFMCLSGDGARNLDLARAQEHLRFLTLKCCSTLERLVSATTTAVFPDLECLELNDLSKLEEISRLEAPIISHGSVDESFMNLKELRLEELPALKRLWRCSEAVLLNYCNLSSIYIEQCDTLGNLFSLSTATGCLPQLKTLDISECKMMERVFSWNQEEEEDDGKKKVFGEEGRRRVVTASFPKLEMLRLCELPNLTTFCRGVEDVEFPLLSDMTIRHCQQLKSVVSSWEDIRRGGADDGYDDHSSHLFCQSKVAFGSLEELNINDCNNVSRLWCHKIPDDSFARIETLRIDFCGKILSAFSSLLAQSLVNLRQLKIRSCGEMVKVIADEDNEEKESKNGNPFPKLRYLELRHLSKLEVFCEWKSCALIEFPSLESVFIKACPRMKRFASGSLTTPKLKAIKVDDAFNSNDINEALQQH